MPVLFADDLPAGWALTLIERYGSFGLVCVLFLGLVFYVLPKFVTFLENQRKAFTDELQAERLAREQAHAKCHEDNAKNAAAMSQVTVALDKVTDRLERVEDEVRRDKKA